MKCAAAVILLLALASVATARPVGLRSLLSDEKKVPVYCSGLDYKPDECPEHYECVALDKKVCKQNQVCTKDRYGKETCTKEQECFEYVCKEIPKYCEVDYSGEDECVTKYGKEYECKKLVKEECVNEKECKFVDTRVCKEYDYEEECKYVDTDVCKDYNQERKCAKDRQVCKVYKKERKCEQGECTKYDKYGKCSAYGQDDCKYVDTKDCKVYETVKGKCTYVNTTCKVYEQKEECKNVKKGCKVYEKKEVCEDVKVCWPGKCVKAPKKAAGYPTPSAGK